MPLIAKCKNTLGRWNIPAPDTFPMFYVLSFPEFDDPETAPRFDRWRKDYSVPHATEIPAHVTLVFAVHSVDEHALLDHCAQIAARTSPITADFNTPMIWPERDGSETLLYTVPEQGAQALTDLHHRLHTGLLADALSHDHPFVPHITLGHFPRFDDARGARAHIANQRTNATARLTSLNVIRAGDSIETCASFPLSMAT
jgi:2'-5' RNA ligase